MFNIIPLILILISLVVISVIVIKKFPILANLDIESIQSEREARFKEQIVSNRLKRNYFRYYNQTMKFVRPVLQVIGNSFKWLYHRLLEFRDNYNKDQAPVEADAEVSIEQLFAEIEVLQKEENIQETENKLIKVISLDPKNIKAFRMLGELYFSRKDFNEAKQTWEHALRLTEKELENLEQGRDGEGRDGFSEEKLTRLLSEFYFDLASVSVKIENLKDALENIKKALKIEPNSPRYLDMMLEISIIKKDKQLAEKTYFKLEKVNPENNKLIEFKKQIDAI